MKDVAEKEIGIGDIAIIGSVYLTPYVSRGMERCVIREIRLNPHYEGQGEVALVDDDIDDSGKVMFHGWVNGDKMYIVEKAKQPLSPENPA